MEAAQWGEQANLSEARFLHGTLRRRSDRQKREGECVIAGEIWRRVLKLIRRYLEAGLMEGGVASARTEGTPQGGPCVPAAIEHSADRCGPGTGEARTSLLPLSRRLQHLCRQRAERAAGDGGDHGVSGAPTEAEGQR
jgi:hypothetical protein